MRLSVIKEGKLTMSIRNMSGSYLGLFILVIAFGGLIAGCGEDQVTATDTTAPAAPIGLRAMAGNTTVYLEWDANSETDLAGYNVYSAVDGAALELVAVVPATSTGYNEVRERGHEYTYEITAFDQSTNESSASNQASILHQSLPSGGVRDNIGTIER